MTRLSTFSSSFTIIGVVVLLFIVFFLCSYPSVIINADEISYLNQAIEFSGTIGENLTVFGQYPLGTSILYSAFCFAMGIEYIYSFNLLLWIVNWGLLWVCLRNFGLNPIWSLVYALHIPTLFSTTMLMSDLPSQSIICVFLFTVSNARINKKCKVFFAFTLIGLSLWFRETNMLCMIPLAIFLMSSIRMLLPALVGFILGVLPRLISASMVYGNTLYIKDPNATFDFSMLFSNTLVFIVFVLLLSPLSIFAFLPRFSNHMIRWLYVGLMIHLITYLGYSYNGGEDVVGRVYLYGRFFLPIVPIFILLISYQLRNIPWKTVYTVFLMCTYVFALFVTYFLRTKAERPMNSLRSNLYEHRNKDLVTKDIPENLKLVNHFSLRDFNIKSKSHPTDTNDQLYVEVLQVGDKSMTDKVPKNDNFNDLKLIFDDTGKYTMRLYERKEK